MATEKQVAVRELPFVGAAGFEPELLSALDAVL
jgi:hypothetical protein